MSSLNGGPELSLPDLLNSKGGGMTTRNDFGRRHFQTCAEVLRSVEKRTDRSSSLENSVSPKARVDRLAMGETTSRNVGDEAGALTVKDVIDYMSRTKNRWGVSGYDFPKFDAKLDKPFHAKISGSKKTSYLDDAMKQTQMIPAPW
jgi:hypothetical protein